MATEICVNIEQIVTNIKAAAARAGRNARDIKLMAVTKTVADERIREALAAGIIILGENYVQEAARKKPLLEQADRPVEWHMIGHLQTRKAAQAVRLFDMIQSLDRVELANEVNKRAKAINRVMEVLIEVNTGEETTKGGVPPVKALEFAGIVSRMENLSLRGLMTIPPWFDDPEKARPYFKCLRELQETIGAANLPHVQMQELSMGMTDDYQVAIEEGATLVRIGRGIFGERR
jgi:pyridoxal phosphate enzyme (YggS family)